MTAKRLFDTCVFIHHLRGKSPEATQLIRQAISGTYPAAFSIITDAELWYAVKNDSDSHAHRLLLSKLTRLPLNLTIARIAGKMRRVYRNRGLKLPDAIIAATAEYHNLPLYTTNVKDFQFISTITVMPYSATL